MVKHIYLGQPGHNLGQDADTTGAIYGQIAGAYFGESGIPAEWLSVLHDAADIRQVADDLLDANGATA